MEEMLEKKKEFSKNQAKQFYTQNSSFIGILLRWRIPFHDSSKERITESITKNKTIEQLPEDILADSLLFLDSSTQQQQPVWKRKRFHFMIGLSAGLLLAAFGASFSSYDSYSHSRQMMLAHYSYLNDLHTYLLTEINYLSKIMPVTDIMDDILTNVTDFFKLAPSNDQSFMPAMNLKDEFELKAYHPVVLIPGIISSGLESWGVLEKSKRFFRKRMWGTATMFRSILLDKDLWIEHLKLDPVTGLDPPGIKIRAAQGLDAADYFITGYWIWAKIIENLAYIGYDNNNMYLASYDWRLSFSNLEIRDQYFSRLKAFIETSKKATNTPVVVVTHSMGSILFPYFLKWVQSEKGGKEDENWTEQHIASFVNIAGPMVGVPKALAVMLSGETRDTMALGSFGAYLLEKFFSRRERASLMQTWAGGSSMLPKGGNVIWGFHGSAPDDDVHSQHYSYGNLISLTTNQQNDNGNRTIEEKKNSSSSSSSTYFDVKESLELLQSYATADYAQMMNTNYSLGISVSKKELEKNNLDPRKWSNSLESQLPIAPSMKIYCLYGVGLPTERSYFYSKVTKNEDNNNKHNSDPKSTLENNLGFEVDAYGLLNGTDPKKGEFMETIVKDSIKQDGYKTFNNESNVSDTPSIHIDRTKHDPTSGTITGIRFVEGDGTVPALSLGFMCTPSGGWTKYADLYNPGNSPVTLKEYLHEQSDSKLNVRGGSKSGDHVDILGNLEMIQDILMIASNKGQNVRQRIISNTEDFAQKIKLEPLP